jgi:hypothetical protein
MLLDYLNSRRKLDELDEVVVATAVGSDNAIYVCIRSEFSVHRTTHLTLYLYVLALFQLYWAMSGDSHLLV